MWFPPERTRHAPPAEAWPSADEAAASRLFSPIPLGPRTALARSWVPAMVPWRASDGGEVTDAVVAWYARLAAGRPAVLVVEATGIRDVPSGPLLRIGDDRFVPGLRRVALAVREASAGETLLFIQLIDFLAIRRRPERGRFIARFLDITDGHRRALGLADGCPEGEVRAALAALPDEELHAALTPVEREALTRGHRERVTDLHLPHVRDLPRTLPALFAAAAARAEQAGFDGVELHYAHAYTMASFLSPTNTRDDGYGGDRDGRVRLPVEVARAVRDRLGPRMVLGARLLGDEIIDGGGRPDDAAFAAAALCRAGLHFVSVSTGGKFDDAALPRVGEAAYPYTGKSGYECMPSVISDGRGPFGRNLHGAAHVRAALRAQGLTAPVVGAGGIGTFSLAERALEAGQCDFVGAARQSLADPDWWRKVRAGRGAEVRRCSYTNYCEGLDQQHKAVTCRLWDRLDLDERDVLLDPTRRRRLVAPPWRPA